MANIIEMPKLSDTMEEGGIASWLKKEGDFVKEGEAFVEIETDKATMEYNSPYEGFLLKILVPAGKATQLNHPICVIGEKGEPFELINLGTGVNKPPVEETKPDIVAPSGVVTGVFRQDIGPSERLRASPLAKKLASDKMLDLTQISGTGPNGRVVLRDVENIINAGVAGTLEAQEPGAIRSIQSTHSDGHDIQINMMRKTIARRLLAAKNEAPHFYLTRSVNMARFGEWRLRLNVEAEAQKLRKVSVNDLLVLAVSRALIKHPEVNSSWQGETIRRFGAAHIAVAVAVPDGLITPVVRNANLLGAREIALQTSELIAKAKKGQLKPEDYQGGTFSISNLGMMGIEEFTAIINPPQAAILAVGATTPMPWVNPKGEIEVQQRMKMTLSCDHRVVDGAVGAGFLQTLTQYLEDPLLILS